MSEFDTEERDAKLVEMQEKQKIELERSRSETILIDSMPDPGNNLILSIYNIYHIYFKSYPSIYILCTMLITASPARACADIINT